MQKKLFLVISLLCSAGLPAQDKKFSLEECRKKISKGYKLMWQLISGTETGNLLDAPMLPKVPFAQLENQEFSYNIIQDSNDKLLRDSRAQHTLDRTLVTRFIYGLAVDNMVKTLAPRKMSSRAKNTLSFLTQAAIGYAAFDRVLAPALIPGDQQHLHQLLYAFKVSSAYLSAQMVSDGIRNLFTRKNKQVL